MFALADKLELCTTHTQVRDEGLLQLCCLLALASQLTTGVCAGLYEQAISLDKSWEKGYFSYAVYLDQLMRDARQRQSTSSSKASSKPVDRLGGRSR